MVGLKINCDLGEGLDDIDAAIMPLIDQASIACGGHAGNEDTMRQCIALAKQYKTQVGAHPSYPDRENFGRRSLTISAHILESSLLQQISSLMVLCENAGVTLAYVKPHGALYNDMTLREDIFNVLLKVVSTINKHENIKPLSLMLQGVINPEARIKKSQEQQVTLVFEGFADRAYTNSGLLVTRGKPHAVFTSVCDVEKQVMSFVKKGGVYSEHKQWLPINVESICVHGDNINAVKIVTSVRKWVAVA